MLRIRHTNAPAVASERTTTQRLWAEIDLHAVQHNTRTLLGRLRPPCRLIAVVKADGYGHGAAAVARAALAAGAGGVAVANVQEGAELRAAGIDAEILIVGPSLPGEAAAIVEHGLVATVADAELARALAAAARGPLDIQVEVDTGMARHGVAAAAAVEFVQSLRCHPELRLRSVYTHFAGLGPADRPALLLQLLVFTAVRQQLAAAGLRPPAHACNTLAACLLPEAHLDAVRIGGGLYGFGAGVADVDLRPALTLKTTVAGLRRAGPGEAVGYGHAHRCELATTLALLPCGYADGLARANWNGAEVLIGGRRACIVGHVSMNQTVVDVGHLDRTAVGDEVVLLGAQGSEVVRAEERARPPCSPYEITAALRRELPRHLLGADEPPRARWREPVR